MKIGTRHVRVTRRFHFDSAHQLTNYPGKCNQLHGHRWELDVTLESKVNPATGLSTDFSDIKKIVEHEVISVLDHQFLNQVLETEEPTAEIIILWIWNELQPIFEGSLFSLRLFESPDSWIDFDGGV